jgi:cytochrome P450
MTRMQALSYEPGTDGRPPPMVCYSGPEDESRWVQLPNGAPELLLLSRRTVIAALTRRFRIDPPPQYGTTGNAFRGKGHLLRRNPPELTAINRAIAPCITLPDQAVIREMAESVATSFGSTPRPRDLITGFCEPLTARFAAMYMRVPVDEWRPHVYDPTNIALGLIEDDGAEARMRPAWDEIDRYAAELVRRKRHKPDGSVLSAMGLALRAEGFSEKAVQDTYATFGTGWPTPVPVLATSILELLDRPDLVAACRMNPPLWTTTARNLVAERSFFALASPRMATEDVTLAPGVAVRRGQVVLPSVAAALQDPTSPSISISDGFASQRSHWGLAFGAGANRCPFVGPSMVLLAVALELIFTKFNLRLAVTSNELDWKKGLLAIPSVIPLRVDRRSDRATDSSYPGARSTESASPEHLGSSDQLERELGAEQRVVATTAQPDLDRRRE